MGKSEAGETRHCSALTLHHAGNCWAGASPGTKLGCPREGMMQVKETLPLSLFNASVLGFFLLESLHWTPGFPERYSCPRMVIRINISVGAGTYYLLSCLYHLVVPAPSSENTIIVCSRISLLTIHYFISMCNILGGFSDQFSLFN